MIAKSSVIMLCIICGFALSACEKDTTCIGMSADGVELFTVEGADLCDSQIDNTNGEYCICED